MTDKRYQQNFIRLKQIIKENPCNLPEKKLKYAQKSTKNQMICIDLYFRNIRS